MTADAQAGRRGRMRRALASLGPGGIAAILLLLVVTLALFGAWLTYSVVGKGELLPWDVGVVYKVEVYDRFTVYADGEARWAPDAVDGILLAVTAGVGLLTYALVRRRPTVGARTRRCFLAVAAGAGYLAVDEMIGLHETVGYNLPWLAAVPGIDRPDDAIFFSYAVPALVFAVVFRRVLLSSRRAGVLLAAGLGAFVAAVGLEAAGLVFEELVEPLATAFVLAGFLLLALDTLGREPGRV